MITILHGEDTASSRNYLIELKTKVTTPVTFDAKTLTLTDLVQEFEGGGLFTNEKAVIIENLLSSKKSALRDTLINYITSHPENGTLLWEEKEIPAKDLSLFKKAVIIPFKFPQSLFQFLDSLKPRNEKILLQLFREVLKTTNEELVLFMLIRQFRILLGMSAGQNEIIDEVKRLAPWQKGKLAKQAHLFSIDTLKAHYKKLFDIELRMKTGGLSQPLTATIDIFLLSL